MRRVRTASGATAVQIVHKRGRDVVGIDHVGSAHDDAALALLLHAARERRHAGQQALELDLDTAPAPERSGRPVVEATGSLILWDALSSVYDALGFSAVRDEAFWALVLGRIIEPTSKVDTVRVLTEVGVPAPSRATSQRCLRRIVERDYRDTVSNACYSHATRGGGLALVLYDLTSTRTPARSSRPETGRFEGLCHEHRRGGPRRRPRGHGLPRPLPGRTLLPGDQDRPGRPPRCSTGYATASKPTSPSCSPRSRCLARPKPAPGCRSTGS